MDEDDESVLDAIAASYGLTIEIPNIDTVSLQNEYDWFSRVIDYGIRMGYLEETGIDGTSVTFKITEKGRGLVV